VSTIRSQIIAAALTALNTSRPMGVPEFEETRTTSVGENENANVFAGFRELPPAREGGVDGPLLTRKLALLFECQGVATASLKPLDVVEPSLAWLSKVLTGNLFGGLATDTEEGETTAPIFAAANPVCRASAIYVVTYTTLPNNAEQAV
jgi:hypothetical protein